MPLVPFVVDCNHSGVSYFVYPATFTRMNKRARSVDIGTVRNGVVDRRAVDKSAAVKSTADKSVVDKSVVEIRTVLIVTEGKVDNVEAQVSLSISIIIPVYNGESYLPACLDSVLAQDYHHLEIIVINDGSTDGTQSILDSYIELEPGMIVVRQANAGPSLARNRGLAIASGDFIFFLDADDTIEPGCLAQLMADYKETTADLVIGSFRKVSTDGSPITAHAPLMMGLLDKDDLVELAKSYLREPNKYLMFAYAWGRLFKTAIIRENQLSYDKTLRSFEDVKFNFDYLRYCESVFVSQCNTYRFLVRDDHSSMTFTIGDEPEQLLGYNQAIGCIESFITNVNPEEDISSELATAYVSLSIIQLIRICINTNFSNYRTIYDVLLQVVNNDKVRESLNHYQVKKGHSRLIPFLMKHQLVLFLILACTMRGRKRYPRKK